MRPVTLVATILLVVTACIGDENPADDAAQADGDITTAASSSPSETVTGGVEVPAEVPELDVGSAVVPPEDIHFDTFDGGSVPLSEATPELIDRLRDAISPISRPEYGGREYGSWLRGDDLIIGYLAGDTAYAYPVKILNFHEIVNDDLDGVPVLVSYCPLCRSGVVYDRRLDGRELTFGNTSALYENDLVMYDHQTGSYWWQVPGEAIVGPLAGARLTPLPSVTTTWEGWLGLHPDSLVLTRDTGFQIPYERDPFTSYPDVVDSGDFPFPLSEAGHDDRLDASTMVLGVEVGDVPRAFPLEDGPAVVHVGDAADEPVVVLIDAEGTAGAFSPIIGDRALTFSVIDGAITDEQTSSTWDVAGRATAGPLAGTELEAMGSRTTFWFAYVASFPDAVVMR